MSSSETEIKWAKKKDEETMITMRINRSILKKVDFWAEQQMQSRSDFIKDKLNDAILVLDENKDNRVTNHYIQGKCSEDDYVAHFDTKKVPEDLKEARKTFLANRVKILEAEGKKLR